VVSWPQGGRCRFSGTTIRVGEFSERSNPTIFWSLLDQAKGNTGEAHENILAVPALADSAVLQKVEQEREEEYFLPDKRYATVENGGGVRGEYDSSRFEKKANGTEECEPL